MKNQNIKTLIVGIDLSTYSKTVANEAKELAKKLKLPLIFVYVYEDGAVYHQAFAQVKNTLLSEYQEHCRKEYKLSAKQQIIIRFGRAHEEIVSVAKLYKKPLIIIGHKGKSMITGFFLGSTAEKLALFSPFPVWIHRGNKIVLPKNLLIPCDLSSRSQNTIKKIVPLQKAFNANTELFHVVEEPSPLLDTQLWSMLYKEMEKIESLKIKKFMRKHPSLKTERCFGSVAEKIEQHAKDFDMIALSPGVYKKSVPMFGTVTTKLIKYGDKPILVVP